MSKFILLVAVVVLALAGGWLLADVDYHESPGSVEGWTLRDGCLTVFADADGSDAAGDGLTRISKYGFCGGVK